MLRFQVLASRQKDQRVLDRGVVFFGTCGFQCIEKKCRIRQIGTAVRSAVPRATKLWVSLVRLLTFIPLEIAKKLFGPLDQRSVFFLLISGVEDQKQNGCFIVGVLTFRCIDPSIRLNERLQMFQSLFDHGITRRDATLQQ